jgi:hypothetical protein
MKTSTIEPNVAMPPDSYILTYLEINGVSVHQLQRPLTPQDDDILLIRIEHVDTGYSRPEELLVSMPGLREMEDFAEGNRLSLASQLLESTASLQRRSSSAGNCLKTFASNM